MGTLYNVTHANEIAKERDNGKRTIGGLVLAMGAFIVADLAMIIKSQREVNQLRNRLDACQAKLGDFNVNDIPDTTAPAELTTQLDAPDFTEVAAEIDQVFGTSSEVAEVVEEIQADVSDVVEAVADKAEDIVEETKDVVEEIVDNAKDIVEETVEKVDKKKGVFEEVQNMVNVTVDPKPLEEAEKKVAAAKSSKKGGKK